ncbi:sulfite exporter TauE/SafE family protein [Candidatus Sulfurimonas marisnigri]|uniref:Probable membrane transporter protein n=1 Tax=Candidatus Sulfurimonas marisnigri TaxID=2740405 RepID=A0A7S7LYB6_9BACT|nr:sulfite exporter TauE/SafE family protein [Candidatus Sulfurimonas marisnigri]QOY53661.1 sulfite exporter TauE/SafE family protein [Candidatus Sulfurimonas marisnigri]
MIELIFLGIGVGTLSGFFGIGGGTILVPLLLLLGYSTKSAIGISVVQMVFSSVYGSYLNNKKGTLDVPMVIVIGSGGFFGALLSGKITSSFDDKTLEIIFLAFAIFALLRLFFKTVQNMPQKELNRVLLFIIGFVLGAVSMAIGVGGSIMLVPILVGFLHVELKKAISAGLFFVVFSSVAGLISQSLSKHVDFESGLIVGLASLFGVYVGIVLKDRVNSELQKKLLVGFYLFVVIYLINRIFING